MNTEFFKLADMSNIKDKLEEGDKPTINSVIEELDRLQNIIKDYELGFSLLSNTFNKKLNSKPKNNARVCKICGSPAKDWPDIGRRTCQCGSLGYNVEQ